MTTDEQLLRRLGKRCRALRQKRELSQMDMVRNLGMSLSHYQKIERGVLDVRTTTLRKLADCFGVSLAELMRGV